MYRLHMVCNYSQRTGCLCDTFSDVCLSISNSFIDNHVLQGPSPFIEYLYMLFLPPLCKKLYIHFGEICHISMATKSMEEMLFDHFT
jgi:hypothetical protein